MREYFEERESLDDRDVCLIDLLPAIDTGNDVSPVEVHKTSWSVVESPNRLMKTFGFGAHAGFRAFLDELLVYQEEVGHHAKITLQDGNEIIVEVYTHGVDDVTEIDREYAIMADAIYEDAKILEVGSDRKNGYENIGF
tara:strand:- start:2377 stop:2793 length:417 start_codon:yes stop_codon:yes gene_type:complete